jgi:hypothetical protein
LHGSLVGVETNASDEHYSFSLGNLATLENERLSEGLSSNLFVGLLVEVILFSSHIGFIAFHVI